MGPASWCEEASAWGSRRICGGEEKDAAPSPEPEPEPEWRDTVLGAPLCGAK